MFVKLFFLSYCFHCIVFKSSFSYLSSVLHRDKTEVEKDEDNQTLERLVLNSTSSERNTLTYIRKEQAL